MTGGQALQFGIGQPVRRKEDPRFLAGAVDTAAGARRLCSVDRRRLGRRRPRHAQPSSNARGYERALGESREAAAGEGGTVAATPTVINALLGALAPFGIADLPMPATPSGCGASSAPLRDGAGTSG